MFVPIWLAILGALLLLAFASGLFHLWWGRGNEGPWRYKNMEPIVVFLIARGIPWRQHLKFRITKDWRWSRPWRRYTGNYRSNPTGGVVWGPFDAEWYW